MALSGRILTSAWTASSGSTWQVALDWTATQSIENNNSTISWKLVSVTASGGYVVMSELRVKFGDEQIYYRSHSNHTNGYKNTVLASGTKVISHNDDGTLSFNASVEAGIYQWAINKSGSGTITLDTIPRAAKALSAPETFTDEDNPSFLYSNPAGTAVSSLQACISLDGSSADVPYRDVDKTGMTYVFNLTEAERNTLRNATKNANSRTVKFYIKTVIGSKTYYSNITRTLKIVNANPTLTVDAVDTNATTKALTGDAHKYIRYYSNVVASATGGAVKGASITSTTGAGTFNNVNQDSFTFKTTDSRGNSTEKTFTGTLIPYVYLTANFKPKISVDGDVTILVKGNYFNGSFGAVANTLTLQYRYKRSGDAYTDWIGYTPEISGNEHSTSIEFTLPNFDYKDNYDFQVQVIDKLATVTPSAYTTNALPVFDWGPNDFNFNVPVAINGNLVVNGVISQHDVPVVDDNPPTDWVVEVGTTSMGSNGTWRWRKWASGKAECYGCRNYGNMGVSTAWGVLFRSEVFNQDLPVGLFIDTPEVIDITFRNSNFGAWIAKHETSAPSESNSGSFIVIRPASATLSQAYISFNVIGRWN